MIKNLNSLAIFIFKAKISYIWDNSIHDFFPGKGEVEFEHWSPQIQTPWCEAWICRNEWKQMGGTDRVPVLLGLPSSSTSPTSATFPVSKPLSHTSFSILSPTSIFIVLFLSYLHKEKTPLSFETILQTQMRKKRKNKKGKAENTWPRNALFLYLLLVSSCIICLELFIVSFVSLLGEGKIRIFWHYMIAPSSCPWVYKLLDQGKKEKSNWISVSEGWMQTELQ